MATRSVKLTDVERGLLMKLIDIVEATEWDAGDYCLTQGQFNALQRARDKLAATCIDATDANEESK